MAQVFYWSGRREAGASEGRRVDLWPKSDVDWWTTRILEAAIFRAVGWRVGRSVVAALCRVLVHSMGRAVVGPKHRMFRSSTGRALDNLSGRLSRRSRLREFVLSLVRRRDHR